MKKRVRVEVVRTNTENPLSVLKRFTKRVTGSGILRRVRSIRYKERAQSPYTRKKMALSRITKRQERERLFKLGKLEDVRVRR